MHGIGVDIIEIARVAQLVERYQGQFYQKVLSSLELALIDKVPDRGRFIAKRLAAKEAFAKAIGTGLRAPLSLTALSVDHDHLGKPTLLYDKAISAFVRSKSIKQVLLSISDSEHYAVAMVMIS